MKIKTIKWEPGQPVLLSYLQHMCMNDDMLSRHKLNIQLLNVNPDNRTVRQKNKWLINRGGIFGTLIEVNVNDIRFDDNGTAFFSKTYDFPDDLWDKDNLPIATITPFSPLPIIVLVQKVTVNAIHYTVYCFSKDITKNTSIPLFILATGILKKDGML